jgi:NhaA family Na+:H+ antiporter
MRLALNSFDEFIKKESSTGILLIFATVAALVFKNTALSGFYNEFLSTPVEIQFGALEIAKPLFLWINDGLMALFFFMIGLEIKREVVEGHLSSLGQIALPGLAAVGGMVFPALVYYYFNHDNPEYLHGWAIPTATDIAFAVGILALLGPRIPASLKIFLLALAIIDDLGAIIIIAVFYTIDLSMFSIVLAGLCLTILVIMNRMGVAKKSAYLVIGAVLWVSVLKSGVHATLAGVALALTIPLNSVNAEGKKFSMARDFEHGLHFWVAALILPLFAFVNAGVDLRGIDMAQMTGEVPLGIALGLFVGKQAGVFLMSALAIKTGMAKLPAGATWTQLYGVAILTGIGFTMSLFIDSLAFTDAQVRFFAHTDKLAVLLGSFASGLVGYLVLLKAKPAASTAQP